jgi:hypothetical protein
VFPRESEDQADIYRLAPEAERFQLPLREIPMLSDYEGCCAQASVSGLSLCVKLCVTAEKARRGRMRRLVAIWIDRVDLRRWQKVEGKGRWVVSVVCRRLCMRALVQFFSFTTVHCAGCRTRSRFAKSRSKCVQSRLLRPSAKRLTLNGFTKRGLSMVVVVVSDRENAEQGARRFRPKSLVA